MTANESLEQNGRGFHALGTEQHFRCFFTPRALAPRQSLTSNRSAAYEEL